MKTCSYNSKRKRAAYRPCLAILAILLLFTASIASRPTGSQAVTPTLVILSRYNCTLKVGQSFTLAGVAANGKFVSWKSSSSRVASVNSYGQVTAKRAGVCNITGKVSGGEASCRVIVEATAITLSATSLTLENGKTATLKGSTSNGSAITWKSQKSSVATVTGNGQVTARKPGETTITASADGTKKTCRVVVKKPGVKLSQSSAVLYRGQELTLTADVSSGKKVIWSSRKTSVATVNANGKVTAKKHGSTYIRAKIDGVTTECEITVASPTIRLDKTSATLKKGGRLSLKATVSSGNKPTWKSSKSSVASVDQDGNVTARQKGSCYISVSEDGTTEKCHIQVTEK